MFKIFIPTFKTRILDSISMDHEAIGYIAGINLKSIDYKDEEMLKRYILNILKIKDKNYKEIFIEELEYFNVEIKEEIEKTISMKFPTGKKIKLYNLPIIIEDMARKANKDLLKEEVLIISDNRKEAVELICLLGNIFNFISLLGIVEEEKEEVYREILDSTGISIFQPINIENSLNQYGIIINLSDNLFFDPKEITRKAIVFDFSRYKPFSVLDNNSIIYDINIKVEGLAIGEGLVVRENISSSLYEGLFGKSLRRYCQVVTKYNNLYIDEYINQIIKIKGEF